MTNILYFFGFSKSRINFKYLYTPYLITLYNFNRKIKNQSFIKQAKQKDILLTPQST